MKQLPGKSRGASAPRLRDRVPPVVEPLDVRIMMSVTAIFSSAGAVLRVVGDDQDNVITVSRDAGGTIFVNNGAVRIAGGTPNVDNTGLIMIVGGAGNDNLALDETGGPLPGAALFGGAGNDTLVGGSGHDFAEGDAGTDTVFLGAGDDTFHWNPGDGSDIVDGQGGNDTLEFNGSDAAEKFDVSDSGTGGSVHGVTFTRDVGNVVMNLSGIESIDLTALGGADTITVNDQSATDLRTVNLDLQGSAGTGDGQPDAVILNGTQGDDVANVTSSRGRISANAGAAPVVNIIGTDPALDRLTVNTLGGADTLDASTLAAGFIGLTLNAGDGDDQIFGSAGDDLVNGGPGRDKAFLEAGDDTFVWNPGDGSDVLEGDAGHDTLQFNGSDLGENFDLSANGSRLNLLRDAGNVAMDVNGVEAVNIDTKGGADNVLIHNLAGIAGAPQIDVNAGNDAAPDTVAVEADNNADTVAITDTSAGTMVTGLASTILVTNADAASDALKLSTLGGNDSITVDQAGTPGAVRTVLVDGGAQTDTLNLLGTAPDGDVGVLSSTGDDAINVNPDAVGVANVSFAGTQRIGALTIGSGGVATLPVGGASVLTSTSLNITVTGRLNVNDNDLIVDYSPAALSPIANIRSLLTSGYHGGAWDGNGIMTGRGDASTFALGFAEASAVAPGGTFAGQTVDASAVLVRFTSYGDANLDGAVDFADVLAVAQNFGLTNANWSQGDLNYDGKTDFVDLLKLAQNDGK